MKTDNEYLEIAKNAVMDTLQSKKGDWTHNAPLFDNFDIMEEFDVSPVRFGLLMCRLKMNRIKSCVRRMEDGLNMNPNDAALAEIDLEDSLQDLACYAIITRAMLNKAHDKLNELKYPQEHNHTINGEFTQWKTS